MLSAPTRKEVDAAHARRKWLSIGVASFKNLLYVDRRKTFVYLLLGISSIPLHLLWNSAFLESLASNEYVYSAVTESFLEGAPWNNSKVFLSINQYPDEAQAMLNHYTNDSLIRLNTTDCFNAYDVTFMTEYSNVLLVYNNAANINGVDNNSLLLQGLNNGGFSQSSSLTRCSQGKWLCGPNPRCAFNQTARDNGSPWNPWEIWGLSIGEQERDPSQNLSSIKIESFIEHCLAEQTKRPCSLAISPPILVTVLICNIIKILCFGATLWIVGSQYPLVTNGDAIQSFLLQSDTNFKNRCLASRTDVENNKRFWSDQPLPIMWHGRRNVWAVGATKGVWLATFIPLWVGGPSAIASEGFGRPSLSNIIFRSDSPVTNSLLANTPQIIVSYIYLAYNNLFTHMLATAEVMSYSTSRKHLRVAFSRGKQRSRKFLQIPYKYGIPIMTASIILHWLISQSLFLVRVTVYDYKGIPQPDLAISVTQFSSYAILLALCMGGAMLMAVLIVGVVRRFPATMPLAACCSASLAALCQPYHGRVTEKDVIMDSLQWGAIGDESSEMGDNSNDGVGHACFSAKEVLPLVVAKTYA
ncbi:MAG: hypothetical protein M1836_001976 [Candelina mexicana]|nr:MAG: hypothetical protein M1836_001976 [Candelina mexicana]